MTKDFTRRCNSIINTIDNNIIEYDYFINEIDKNKKYRTNGQHESAVQYLLSKNILFTNKGKLLDINFTKEELNYIDNLIKLADDSNAIDENMLKLKFNESRYEIICKYLEDLGYVVEDLESLEFNDNEDNDYDEYEEEYFDIKDKNVETYSSDNVKTYIKEISNYKLLSPEEEYELAIKYKETEDTKYKEILVNHNLRLAFSIAKTYAKKTNLPLLDLVQYGNLGLLNAIDKFDPYLGNKLSTYAVFWIRQSILRGIGNDSRLIRMPIHAAEQAAKNRKAKKDLENNLGRKCTEVELIDYINKNKLFVTGVSHMDLYNLRLYDKYYVNSTLSFSQPIKTSSSGTDSDESELIEFIESPSLTPEEEVENTLRKETVNEVISQVLDEKERTVIIQRFGLDGNYPRTLQDISELYNVSRERIRQIENKALRKLKKSRLVRIKLKDFN